MIRCLAGVLLAVGVSGQEPAPGIVRGALLQAEAGVLQVRQASGSILRCGFDTHTWIERDRKRVQMDALDYGVPVEVLTDTRAGRCYTRTVRLNPPVAAIPLTRRSATATRSSFESIFPRGNLTFAGVVIRRSPTLLVVRTRTEPEKMVTLREDTRYLDSGLPTSASELAVNTRVFIRGGKNFENDLEAFQVVWGEIAGPKSSGIGR